LKVRSGLGLFAFFGRNETKTSQHLSQIEKTRQDCIRPLFSIFFGLRTGLGLNQFIPV
jgi:hypothetical protein